MWYSQSGAFCIKSSYGRLGFHGDAFGILCSSLFAIILEDPSAQTEASQ